MFDFNSLFNKAFPSADGRFDPNVNYYTVFINCAGHTNYYDNYNNQRRIHMGDSYYKEIDVSGMDVDSFRTQIMSLDQEFAVKINTAYVFLMDLAENNYQTGFKKEFLEVVRTFKQPSDTIGIITILPEDPVPCNSIIDNLENDVLEGEVLYLYNKIAYREALLSDSICGVVLLHSKKAEYSYLRSREQQQIQTVNNAITGLPEEGAAIVRSKTPIFWSSLGCSFSNPKMDHLRCYLAILCDKVKKMTAEEYEKLCGELYSGMAEDNNIGRLKNLLKSTLNRIPRIEKNLPKYEGYTLKDYFGKMFGPNGTNIVELSFKATLSMLYDDVTENLIANTARMLFQRSAEFHSENLFEDICNFLDEFSLRFENYFKESKKTMSVFMEQNADNDSLDEDIDRYIMDYLRYYECQKRSDFWNGVESYVKNHANYFKDECARSKALHDSVQQLKRELQLRNEVNIDPEAVKRYPAHRIINIQNDEQLCREIAALYVPTENIKNGSDAVNMSFLFRFSNAPGFSDEIRHEFATGNGGYSAFLTQYIGKYLHFLKGRKV